MKTVAVVTGAGRGLGRKIAERLAARGHHVVATDIDEAAAQVTAAAIDGTAVAQDVRDPDGHRAVARTAAGLGSLVLWVNNAGVLEVGDTWDIADPTVRRVVEVDLLGVIWGCHAAIAHMTSGHILNIASMAGLAPAPGMAVYSATKHGVLGYSLSLAGELRRANRPIAISTLCPDAIAGDMTGAVAHDPAAGLLFSASKLLSLDEVADAALGLVDRPRLVRALPAYRAALVHLFRPFPALVLPVLARLARLGLRNQRIDR